MANAKLHIICGNCGQNDMFGYEVVQEEEDVTAKVESRVYIYCNNCSTLHDLEDNATLKQKNNDR